MLRSVGHRSWCLEEDSEKGGGLVSDHRTRLALEITPKCYGIIERIGELLAFISAYRTLLSSLLQVSFLNTRRIFK